MDIDPLTVFAVGGVASLLIERFFYYRSKYRNKKNGNPGHGERIQNCETEIKNLKENNKVDHELIRKDIRKLFNLFNGLKK